MTPCNQSCLVPEILSILHVEDHVAPHRLVVLWDIIFHSLKHFEGGADVLHLFADGVPPKCVPILLVYLLCLLNRFGYTDTKLVAP